jgi:acyl-CoA thioesterase FadM
MFRTSSPVTTDDTRPLIADVDPTAPGYGFHLSFDRILRRCGLAWTEFLNSTEVFHGGVICPHLSADYLSEVNEGTLEVDITVLSVGRTSFRILCAVSQAGVPAANVQVVLVCFDYAAQASLPLTEEQRAALAAHQD